MASQRYGFFMVAQCFLSPFYSILLDFLETPRGTAQQPGALLFGGPSLEFFNFWRQLDAVVRSRNFKNRALLYGIMNSWKCIAYGYLWIFLVFFHTVLSLHIHIVEISPFKMRHRISARQPRSGGGSRQQLSKCACASRV